MGENQGGEIDYKKVIKEAVLDKLDFTQDSEEETVLNLIDKEIFSITRNTYLSIENKRKLRKEILHAIRGLDILDELMEDKKITEIMINGHNNIFIEKEGRISQSSNFFESEERLEDVIQQIVGKTNRIVNEANPIVDTRLSDGSRVNVVLPPISLEGPVVTIRKFPEKPITIERLISIGSITKEAADFLERLVIAGYNIFISGGTGSGKTTFLNSLSNFVPKDERIITIEDSAELQIKNIPNLVRLEVRNTNVEGNNGISIRDLIKSSLRMRPDRIIVGEVRDAAAIDMLAALNTGHDGSLSTGHANSPKDMLSRLESLVLLGADIPLMAIRHQIASALDVIVHLGRLRDKSRKVLEIVEVLDFIDGEIPLNPLYIFKEESESKEGHIIGALERTPNKIQNVDKLIKAGIAYEGL